MRDKAMVAWRSTDSCVARAGSISTSSYALEYARRYPKDRHLAVSYITASRDAFEYAREHPEERHLVVNHIRGYDAYMYSCLYPDEHILIEWLG